MRVAVITQSLDRAGGVETYLEAVLPALAHRHQVVFCSASTEVTRRGSIMLPSAVPVLRIDGSAGDPAAVVRTWRPDLLFAHGLDDPSLEARLLDIAPAVIVEHTYHGTCISSAKTMSWPTVTQCGRPFGAACLALYFPRRCGGANPLTMARLYRTQAARLRTLKNAAAVVTLSNHMAAEMRRNGVPADRVHVVPPFVSPVASAGGARPDYTVGGPCRLLYLGRLEPLKGVDRLLRALPAVAKALDRPIRLVVAGDGAGRGALEALAATVEANDARIDVQFVGWQGEPGRSRLFAETDALVVPSLWPEPFGLVGLEAAAAGVPAVAFAAGGIVDWLRDGENGSLAPAAGANPIRLAEAIVRCVGTPEGLAALSAGARRAAAQWTLARHMARLDDVFDFARGSAMPHAS